MRRATSLTGLPGGTYSVSRISTLDEINEEPDDTMKMLQRLGKPTDYMPGPSSNEEAARA